jgi:hypothetical protein
MLHCTTAWRSFLRWTPSCHPSPSRRRPTRVRGRQSDTAPLQGTPLRMSNASLPRSRRRWRAVSPSRTPRPAISFRSTQMQYNLALWSVLTRVVGHSTTGGAMRPGRSTDCCGAWRSRRVSYPRTVSKPLILPVRGVLTRCARRWRTT